MSSLARTVLTGADPTGTNDSTAAFTAAMNSLPYGGTIYYGPGKYKVNLVINKSGIMFEGPGGHLITNSTLSFLQPYDVNLPVVQIGDDTVNITGSGIRNAQLYTPTATGKKGLVFAGGARKCYVENIQSQGFTVSCLEFRNDDILPCTFNKAINVDLETNRINAYALSFIDLHSNGATTTATSISGTTMTCTIGTGVISIGAPVSGSGVAPGTTIVAQLTGTPGGSGTYQVSISQTVSGPITTSIGNGGGWTTANEVIGFSVTASHGQQVYVESANTNSISGGYVQGSYSGNGILLVTPQGRGYGARLDTYNVEIDSVSGPNNVTVVVDNYGVSDYRTNNFNNLVAINGVVWSAGRMFTAAGHTTGSITSGTNTLTVTSATGIYPGRAVRIMGAYVSGDILISKVTAVSGTTITIADNASTTATSVDVMYGDVCGIETKGQASNTLYGALNVAGQSGKEGLLGVNYPVMYLTGSNGVAHPWSNYHVAFDLRERDFSIIQKYGAPTISTITQSGTTVTVTTSGSHSLGAGDLFTISGVNEAGINGTYAIATYVSATSFTYTSAVSQTLGSVTGTPVMVGFKQANFSSSNGRLELNARGLALRNHLGTLSPVLSHSTTQGQMTLQTADVTTGQLVMTSGNTQSATNHAFAWYAGTAGSGSEIAYLYAQGNLYLIKAAAPTTNSAGGYIYCATVDSKMHVRDSAGNDGAVLHTGNSTGTFTSASPAATASPTAVMMAAGAATITTKSSTRVLVVVSGQMANSTAGSGATVDLRFGTGTAPTNGAAVAGTLVGISQTTTSVSAAQKSGFCLSGIATVTVGTATWFDLSLLAPGGTGSASVTGVTITLTEI